MIQKVTQSYEKTFFLFPATYHDLLITTLLKLQEPAL